MGSVDSRDLGLLLPPRLLPYTRANFLALLLLHLFLKRIGGVNTQDDIRFLSQLSRRFLFCSMSFFIGVYFCLVS